jgi:acetolactate synthase small subunit
MCDAIGVDAWHEDRLDESDQSKQETILPLGLIEVFRSGIVAITRGPNEM